MDQVDWEGRTAARFGVAIRVAFALRRPGDGWGCLSALLRPTRPRAGPWRCRPGSVLVGAHDRQDARRDGGISGIGRAELGGAVVVLDFPEAADAALVDRAEVVLAVGIVVVGEGVEGANLRQQRATLLERHGFDAGGDHDDAADEGAAEGVVEGADAFGGGHGGAGHGFGLLRLGLGWRAPGSWACAE